MELLDSLSCARVLHALCIKREDTSIFDTWPYHFQIHSLLFTNERRLQHFPYHVNFSILPSHIVMLGHMTYLAREQNAHLNDKSQLKAENVKAMHTSISNLAL